mmetsp:Transcript_8320/g.11849  ORF Transcript_8320/g.11849 Transcript_8320/m.11849 type:complete len:89 (-) Transcript_8320:418-684(-)
MPVVDAVRYSEQLTHYCSDRKVSCSTRRRLIARCHCHCHSALSFLLAPLVSSSSFDGEQELLWVVARVYNMSVRTTYLRSPPVTRLPS